MSEQTTGSQGEGQASLAPAPGGNPGNNGGAQSGATNTTSANNGGGQATSWKDALPEDIRKNPAIATFQDVESLTKSFIHAQGQIGKKGVVVPGEKATDEEWGNFYKQIGVPNEDKYEIQAPKDYKMTDEVSKQFKAEALKAGLLPKQANKILGWYAQFETNALKAQTDATAKAQNESHAALKQEWGDSYNTNLQSAQLAVKEIGGDRFLKYLQESGMAKNAELIRFAANAAKLMGEDKLREGGVSSGGESPREIQEQLTKLRAEGTTNGLFDKSHPMHSVTLSKMESLAKRLTGGR